MIKAFVFDLDGTLVDTVKDIGQSVNYSLKKNGFLPIDLDIYYKFIGNGSKKLIQRALNYQNLSDVSKSLFEKIYTDYLNYYQKNVCVLSKPYKNVSTSLNKLKSLGYKLFVVTNKPLVPANKLIEKLFPNIFDKVYGINVDTPVKPNPYLIEFLCKENSLKCDELVYIGDSDVDMQLANNSNIINKIACLYGYRPKEELLSYNPKLAINDFAEIFKIIN